MVGGDRQRRAVIRLLVSIGEIVVSADWGGTMGALSRAAVLGASGCVGRQVCASLSRAGYEVLAIARSHAPQIREHQFVPLDIASAPAGVIAKILDDERVDVVVNAAGRLLPDAEDMVAAYLRPTERILEALTISSRQPRFVHIGTIHEYGPVPYGTLVHEGRPPAPTNTYARTKLAASNAVLAALNAEEVRGVVLRAANTCGPHPAQESFPALLLQRFRDVVNSGDPVVLDIGDARRDYVDVRDVAEAARMAASASVTGRVINIGSGVAVHMSDFATLFVSSAGLSQDLLHIREKDVHSHGGNWTRTDIQLAEQVLGWRPRYDLRDSLVAMWNAGDTP